MLLDVIKTILPILIYYLNYRELMIKDREISYENWSEFSIELKADLVIAEVLMEELNLTRQEAFEKIVYNKQTLLRLLQNQYPEAVWNNLFSVQQHEIVVFSLVKKQLFANFEMNYMKLLEQATYFFWKEFKPISAGCVEEVFLYQLKEVIDSWVNWDILKQKLPGPLASLKIVLAHYKRPFPYHFFNSSLASKNFPNIRLLLEAALLYREIHNANNMFPDLECNKVLALSMIEKDYLHLLSEDWIRQSIIDQLFSKSSVGNNRKAAYFNGIAFEQATGKIFNDLLLHDPVLEKNPNYKIMDRKQRISLLKEKFSQIGEDTEYPIGSIYHSMASILMRMYDYHGLTLPKITGNNPLKLIEAFKQLEVTWELEKDYPIQPRVLLALHLSISNDVTISGENWEIKMKNLLIYLQREFEKVFLDPPHFDRVKVSKQILLNMGMDHHHIYKKRYYVITADNPNLSMTYFGSPLEEFTNLLDWNGVLGNFMCYRGKCIEPRVMLQAAEDLFNANLYQDPWIQNKARNNLNKLIAAPNDPDIDHEVKRITENYVTETENHRVLLAGLKEWLSTIPIVGPIQEISEGIQNEDYVEVICGVFFLGIDALNLLSGAKESKRISHESLKIRENLSIKEQKVIDNIEPVFKALKISADKISTDNPIPLHFHSSFELRKDIPSTSRALIDQIIIKKQGLKWNEYEVAYLKDENCVIPIAEKTGYYHEINWYSRKINYKKRIIFKDIEFGEYYSNRIGLKDGDFGVLELNTKELKQRNTVKEIENIFKGKINIAKNDFSKLFRQCFSVKKEIKITLINTESFYCFLYENSPTFRRIFNRYYDEWVLSKKPGMQWNISIQSNSISRTDFASKTIYISSDAKIKETYYMSNINNFERSQPEQVYLHEMLHALTGAYDPIKAISTRHRGPIVYLTDKILTEAGYLFPQRVMYKRFNPMNEEKRNRNNYLTQHREDSISLSAKENEYLDNLIDNQIPVIDYLNVFSEQLLKRYTVKEIDSLWTHLDEKKYLSFSREASFEERFLERFDADNKKTLRRLGRFYTYLYNKSDKFAYLFDIWCFHLEKNLLKPWRFELSSSAAQAELPAQKKVHCINNLTNKIYIFDDKTLYLSNKGLLKVERVRQFVHEMVQIITGLQDLPTDTDVAIHNRGAIVQITDQIFEQINLKIPKRIAYKLVMPDDLTNQLQLLNYQLEASRMASLEDRFIMEMDKDRQQLLQCLFRCPKKRSLQKKPHIFSIDRSRKIHSQHEDIVDEMKKIKVKLETLKLFQKEEQTSSPYSYLTNKSGVLLPFFSRNTLDVTLTSFFEKNLVPTLNNSLSNK